MVNEEYVSFETASLLSEKGFNELCDKTYISDNGKVSLVKKYKIGHGVTPICSVPTQALVMRWLRDVHHIDIIVFHEILDHEFYWYRIEKMYGFNLLTEYQDDSEDCFTYEQACEEAIKYCLNNIVVS